MEDDRRRVHQIRREAAHQNGERGRGGPDCPYERLPGCGQSVPPRDDGVPDAGVAPELRQVARRSSEIGPLGVDPARRVDPLHIGELGQSYGKGRLLLRGGVTGVGDDDLERVGLTLPKIGPQGVVDLPDLIAGAEDPVVEVSQTEVDDRGGKSSEAHHHGDDDEHGPAHHCARRL